jgi:hypothetical protein
MLTITVSSAPFFSLPLLADEHFSSCQERVNVKCPCQYSPALLLDGYLREAIDHAFIERQKKSKEHG